MLQDRDNRAVVADISNGLTDGIKYATIGIAIALVSILSVNFVTPIRSSALGLDDLRMAYLTELLPQDDQVVVLEINEDTLGQLEYRSPIDREFLAGVLTELIETHSVRTIGLDLIFDQRTSPSKDELLRSTVLNSPVDIIVASGGASAGLNMPQLVFQSTFLAGMQSGSAALETEDGTVRTYHPFSRSDGTTSFSNAVLEAAGIEPPAQAVPIYFRRGASNNARPIRSFPAHSVGLLPPKWLEDRIILIGAVVEDRDQHRTPLSILAGQFEFLPGVQIHAQILSQLISGYTVPRISTASLIAITLLAVLFGFSIELVPMATLARILVAAMVFVGYWVAGFSGALYEWFPLPLVQPSLGFLTAIGIAATIARKRERQQKVFLHGAFNQYVSEQIIADILANPDHLKLGGEQRAMSFIFTDIAGFSTLAENMEPTELVALLSEYLDGVVDIALEHHGTIARFVGDGLVIFFGAPVEDSDHRLKAVRCAISIDQFCESYRRRSVVPGGKLGVTRIGVHSGVAVVGNVGGSKRFEYTAHGDCVNTAARLEGANRHLGTRVCFSADVVPDEIADNLRPIGRVVLKGKSQWIEALTIWDDADAELRDEYLHAFDLLCAEESGALKAWEDLIEKKPGDPIIELHASRLRAGGSGTIFTLQEK